MNIETGHKKMIEFKKLKHTKIIRKVTTAMLVVTVSAWLAGCAEQSLKAPCPQYGAHCSQTPVNSWDSSAV